MANGKIKQKDINIKLDYSEILKSTGKQMTSLTKQKSPKNTGKYSNGWTAKQIDKDNIIIFNNSKEKSLSHLLEFGHKKRNGKGFVAPQEHIRPSFNITKKSFLEKLKKIKITKK